MKYHTPAISAAEGLIYGRCPHPVTCAHNLVIGGGKVLPEINFTLPPMPITDDSMDDVVSQYRGMVTDVCRRAVDLKAYEIVVELELLPEMTMHPEWGARVTATSKECLERFQQEDGLSAALRVTPTDIRESPKPPARRTGDNLKKLLASFEDCAAAGADILSIESIGGKEVYDPAIFQGDIAGVLFALCVLGARDMEFLWREICGIAQSRGVVPGGDTACAFANTAMVLADKRSISKVFAAVVRTVSAVRSLVAYEQGATGPGKDCGYENVILKAITGCPMSMEGKSAACAHPSHVGNIACATADLWSNESVQNVRLLSGPAPVVSMEQLIYDCRLLNAASDDGGSLRLRDWLVASDERHDPQAFILSPKAAVELAQTIVSTDGHYLRGLAVARRTIDMLREAHRTKRLDLADVEVTWLDRTDRELARLPQDEEAFIHQCAPRWGRSFIPAEYGLSARDYSL